MTVTVLCSSDIHMGRRLSRVQEVYRSVDAWNDIVKIAVERSVDVVALGGDIVDHVGKTYEALGPLQTGLRRLAEAGIETVAVAGNHDYDALPTLSLASIVDDGRFHLLGQKGNWERYTFHRAGKPVLHIDGWSFSQQYVYQSPLESYRQQAADSVPVLGLFHGDLGNINSKYNPLSVADLRSLPFHITVLGHIHKPEVIPIDQARIALYPGSPYALDPGETGIHGVWLAQISGSQPAEIQKVPLSPVLYRDEEVNLESVADQTDFIGLLHKRFEDIVSSSLTEYQSDALKTVSLRLLCVGKTPAYQVLPHWVEHAREDLGQYLIGEVNVEIDQLLLAVTPPIDLIALAVNAGPVGETARLILALEEKAPTPPYNSLLDQMQKRLNDIDREPGYSLLNTEEENGLLRSDRGAVERLKMAAWQILSGLVAQKES